MSLILASASPRRRELLSAAGIKFTVVAANIPESPRKKESAAKMVARLAKAKASAVAILHPKDCVLGADTTVVIGGKILEKPINKADARRMLILLAGCWHTVYTAVAIVSPNYNRCITVKSQVFIGPLNKKEIADYIKTGEPFDKAGGYAIQGHGAALVREVRGSYTNVVGLPLYETIRMLRWAKAF